MVTTHVLEWAGENKTPHEMDGFFELKILKKIDMDRIEEGDHWLEKIKPNLKKAIRDENNAFKRVEVKEVFNIWTNSVAVDPFGS